MKKYLLCAIIVCFLSFGLFGQAGAQDGKIQLPQGVQDLMDRGEKIGLLTFFPFVPTGNPHGFPWETHLIISNWSDQDARIIIQATLSQQDPSIRQLQMTPFEQRIIRLNHLGIFHGIANVLVVAQDAPIGAAAIMVNTRTGEFISSLPPMTVTVFD